MKKIGEIARDTYDELERLNPDYVRKLNEQATYDTPLFNSIQPQPLTGPAPTIAHPITRDKAFRNLRESGTIAHRQMEILEALDEMQYGSIRAIAKYLNAQMSSVSGRVAELRDQLFLIVKHDTIRDPETNQTVIRWKLNPDKFN